MVRYAELHCHTNFSFLDGASHPHRLVERAAELGYAALAVTDHDGFYGAARFHQAAEESGLPTVYGAEVGLPREPPAVGRRPSAKDGMDTANGRRQTADRPRRGRLRRMHGQKPIDPPPTDHLVLLAPSPAGYAAISRFITR
ncbi:MAG: PHP domain-containing protein, partial [Acidimicrobiia bacterium]